MKLKEHLQVEFRANSVKFISRGGAIGNIGNELKGFRLEAVS